MRGAAGGVNGPPLSGGAGARPVSSARPTSCCLGCVAAAALLGAATTLLLIGLGVGGPGFLVGAVVACLPAPIYVALALWLDRYEPEPPLYLLAAFLWGAGGAIFLAFVGNTFDEALLTVFLGSSQANVAGAVLSAPLVEEAAKGAFLLLLYVFASDEFDDIVDGVIYATMVALGFAMTENIQYYGNAFAKEGFGGLAATALLRGILAPYSHPLFTCMTGVGFGWARQSDRKIVKFLAPAGGLLAAMTLHFLWNASASIHGGLWLLAYVFIMMPTAVALMAVVYFSLRREGRLLHHYLAPEVEAGRLEPADYRGLQSMLARIRKGFSSLWTGGPSAWIAYERYASAASELAFLRHRVVHEALDADQFRPREANLIEQMRMLRQGFR